MWAEVSAFLLQVNQKLGYRILASFALKLPLLSFLFIQLFIYLVHISFLFHLSFLFILKQFIALNDSVLQVLNLKRKSCEFTWAKNACKISQPHYYTEWKAVAYVCYIYLAFLSQNWSTIKKKAALKVMPLNK